jgi:acetyltransferase-like isoleucine patch superfamily enzyme
MIWKSLKIISRIFALLPNVIFNIFWRLLDIFDGRIGAILRYTLASAKFAKCGDVVYIGPFVCIDDIRMVSVGSNVSIHRHCVLLGSGGIEIGNNVSIAHSTSIVSTEHSWGDAAKPIKYNPIKRCAVKIGDDVWVGCGVRILSGNMIGGRSVIAAGAVVTSDCQPGGVYGGVPARLIKKIA